MLAEATEETDMRTLLYTTIAVLALGIAMGTGTAGLAQGWGWDTPATHLAGFGWDEAQP